MQDNTIENLVDQFDDDETKDDFSFLKPGIPVPPFRMTLNGVSGNGKTNLILNLITKFYINEDNDTCFTRGIHIFSPSVLTDKAYNILPQLRPDWVQGVWEGNQPIKPPSLYMYDDIDLDHITNLVSDFTQQGHALIIVDDAAATELLNSKKFVHLFIRSRHKTNSWIITSQSYRLIHKTIRNNASDIILYNIINEHELKLIEHELITNKVNLKQLQTAINSLKPFQFLHKDVRANKWFYNLSTKEIK